MHKISLPNKPKYFPIDEFSAKFEIEGCYPGYGTTLGNAIRRVLLSSLEGAAITSVKIKGVSHEFSTIPGVMEDVVQVILNLKKVRFQMFSEEPVKITLKSKGEGKVMASEIKCPSDIKVVNGDQVICTVSDKKSEVEMEFEVSKGLGYIPVEQQQRDVKEIGVIATDAVYTPIKRVNYDVENMRVGKRTDYDKITIEVVTDGSISPKEAFEKAVNILVDQFSTLLSFEDEKEAEVAEEQEEVQEPKKEKKEEEFDPKSLTVEELSGLSTRTLNVLQESKVAKVKQIVKMTEAELGALEGMGAKGIKEIKKAVGEHGLTLKQE